MNNEFIMKNTLSLTKSLAKLYCDGYIESANKKVTALMKDSLDSILSLQQDLFQTMADEGLYELQNVKSSDIEKTYNNLISNN